MKQLTELKKSKFEVEEELNASQAQSQAAIAKLNRSQNETAEAELQESKLEVEEERNESQAQSHTDKAKLNKSLESAEAELPQSQDASLATSTRSHAGDKPDQSQSHAAIANSLA